MSGKRNGGKPMGLTVDAHASKSRQRRDSVISPSFTSPLSVRFGYGKGGTGNISETFYQLVVSKPPLTHSEFSNAHKLLLQDPSSISGLLEKDATREPFILEFQEEVKSIIDFYNKLSPFFKKNPAQNAVLARALLEGVVIPLIAEQYQDILVHDEMMQLVSVSLRSHYDCDTYSSPGLVAQLVAKLVMFPETKVLERFISHPDSGELFVVLVKDQKYGKNMFEHNHDNLVAWIDRLVVLSNCGFDHGIAGPVEAWKHISTLKATYPQPTALTPSSAGFHVQRKFDHKNLRKLTEQDKKSGNSKSSDSQKINVPPATVQLFQALNTAVPKTLSAAQNAVRQLELTRAFDIFQEIAQSFPCSTCSKPHLRDGPVVVYPGNYPNDVGSNEDQDMEACRVEGSEVFKMELKHLGIWRIVLSRQAMKDFSDSRRSGQFTAVESKLRELATGNWAQRKALTKKHINPDFPIPIKKAVYDDNGRIIWHVYLSYDEVSDSATQVILVWRIGDHKEVVKSEEVILRHQKTFRSDFVDACKLRFRDPAGTYHPRSFGTKLLDQEHITSSLTREESLDLHNAVITGKFYTLTQTVLDGILASGSSAEFPFDVAHDEVEIIRQDSAASFILGRSGTGKTTCLAFKLLSSYIGSRATIEGGLSTDAKPVRQIFITRSDILANKLNGYIRRLINCQLGRFDSDDIDGVTEILKEKDEESEAPDLWSLKDEDFPLVCTFDKLLAMVETSIKKGGRKFWEQTSPESPTTTRGQRGIDVNRIPREVDAQTFIQHYWSKFPATIKKNIPVDLVFSEIMGIIKGSTSSLRGRSLRALTREEYLNRSCRVAPLFTDEAERKQVYTIYEHYERMKAEYRDWDGVDKTRNVVQQMRDNPALKAKLREVFQELYVDEIQDQRLLEIEFLLQLIQSPRGVHLAGDSAQCISRDSTFRFSDIKALFYDVYDEAATAINQSSLAKPKEFKLAHNYRSHQGIIALGALLIECLWRGFPDLIDKLLPEIGKYSGPKPMFFSGFKAEDVLVSQAFGVVDLYDQLADFGADQVILVRDEEVQNQIHSRVGTEVLILTVLQSKGMEFEDVVLLNFFSSSGYAASYRSLDRLIDKKYGDFDKKKHSVLCAELKTLYVAVTRCRANLRIIEEDKAIAELIVDFWTNKVPKPLIDTVRPGDHDAPAKIKALRSGNSGNPALWLKNGQHLMHKKLYKQALFCFMKTSDKQRQIHALAHLRRQEAENLTLHKAVIARDEIKELYRQSAKLFLEAEHPLEASKSLEAAGLLEEAAKMWIDRGRPEKAAPLYERAGKYKKASKTYHQATMYTEATKSLRTGELYEDLVEYLETVKDNLDSIQYQRSSKLCNLLAHQGKLNQSYKSRTLRLLGTDLKIELFYRQRGYTKELLELFASKGRTKDAYYYLISIGKIKEAVLLAPFKEMQESIPSTELTRMQQLLLISDLRATKTGKPPVYADQSHPHARPGLDILWDALYRSLKHLTRIETAILPSDQAIEGYIETKPYMEITVMERMDDVLNRVGDFAALPTSSVDICLNMLRQLYFARDEAPDTIRRFVGAYRQPNRTSLLVHSTSLLNINTLGRTIRQISPEQLLQMCMKWFAKLVINASIAYLEKAKDLILNARSGAICVHYVTTGTCSYGNQCNLSHQVLNSGGFRRLCLHIQGTALVTSKLRFFFSASKFKELQVVDADFFMNFRSRQRKWLESLLTELTYISPIQQDPVVIQTTPVFRTHEEQFKPLRWLCDDMGLLLFNIHLGDEWNSRNTFSSLLEVTQRAEKLSSRISYEVRRKLALNFRTKRLQDKSRQAARRLFISRPIMSPKFQKNYDFWNLENYVAGVVQLPLSELMGMHALLSHLEQIATYLLLLQGDHDEFLILTSWLTVHVPNVGPAYCNTVNENLTTQLEFKWQLGSFLMRFVQCLMDLINKIQADPKFKFRVGGERGTEVARPLLLRRCFDIVCICVMNIQTLNPVPQDWYAFAREHFWAFAINTAKYLNIQLPSAFIKEIFFKNIAASFAVYAGKESITLVQNTNTSARFSTHRTHFTDQIKMINFSDIDPFVSFDAQHSSAYGGGGDEELDDQDEEGTGANKIPQVKQAAAKVICQFWKKYWPRLKAKQEWKNTPLGQATTIIDKRCEEYQPELRELPQIYHELYTVYWLNAPRVYEAIKAAEAQGSETSESYQTFFTSLYGSKYTDEDLERVEELFEEVEANTGKIEEMKAVFGLDGMRKLWSRYLGFGENFDAAAEKLREDMAGMQKEAAGIRHCFIRLGKNKYLDGVAGA